MPQIFGLQIRLFFTDGNVRDGLYGNPNLFCFTHIRRKKFSMFTHAGVKCLVCYNKPRPFLEFCGQPRFAECKNNAL